MMHRTSRPDKSERASRYRKSYTDGTGSHCSSLPSTDTHEYIQSARRARFGSTFAMDDAGDADVRHHSTAYRRRRHEHLNFPWFQWWFLIRFMILEKSISTSLFYH